MCGGLNAGKLSEAHHKVLLALEEMQSAWVEEEKELGGQPIVPPGYPKYMPSFDEFISDFSSMFEEPNLQPKSIRR